MSSARTVKIGGVIIGGDNKIAIQSMTNTKTKNIDATLSQIYEMEQAGCDIVRCAVKDTEDAAAFRTICEKSRLPVVADIHFDYRLALSAMENGAAKVRVNPGNLGDIENFGRVIDCAKSYGCSIRIGVNSGSVNKDDLAATGNKYRAMLESIERYARYAEGRGFEALVLSAKSTSVRDTIAMGRAIRERFDYPLHLGVTEAGVYEDGIIKSSIGIGSLLFDNIGETIRVSLTDDPVLEVNAAKKILKALGLYEKGVEVISCPTCGRCGIDLTSVARQVKKHVENMDYPLKIAVMGCVVNGPGEAQDADVGLAGGENCALIFEKGKPVLKIEGNLAENFISYLDEYIQKRFGKN